MMGSALEELKMMNWRIFTAILVGCIFGGAVVYGLALAGQWYFLGVPVGGAVAWLVYVWRDVVRVAPDIWWEVSHWRPNLEFWKNFSRFSSAFLAAFGAFASSMLVFGTILFGVTFGEGDVAKMVWSVASEPGTPLILASTVALFVLVPLLVGLKDEGLLGPQRSTFEARQASRFVWGIALHTNPVGVLYHVVRVLVWMLLGVPRATLVVGRFLLRLFVAVHSKDVLDCFIYAAVGTLVGALVTQEVLVMAISAVVGLGLAFVMRLLAGGVPERWYVNN